MKYKAYKIELTNEDKKFIENYDLGKYNDTLREHCNDKKCVRAFSLKQLPLIMVSIMMLTAIATNDIITKYLIVGVVLNIFTIITVLLVLGMELKNSFYILRRNKFCCSNENFYGIVWSTAYAPQDVITVRFKSNDIWYETNVEMVNHQPFRRGELFQFCVDTDRGEIYPSFDKNANCTTFDQRVYGFL